MTDTESKEVEIKPCPFCGNQPSISEAGHWAEVVISCNCHAVPQVVQRCVSVPNEDGKTFHYDHERAKREAIDIWNSRPQDNNPEEGETKNDIAWQQGYAAGKKYNKLVPLDKDVVGTEWNKVYGNTKQPVWTVIEFICAKFGKDNNQCETIAGSSFKFLSNKEEDIYTFEDGKPIGKDNSGMLPILKNEQLISDPVNGDCFRACVTSLLGIPNSEIIPSCGDGSWFVEYSKFLGKFGLNVHYEEKACWRNGYWIASVPSLNFPKVTHAIIMNCQEVYFDPSPNKKYTEGENLLGKDVVLGGWYFEVEDFSKLRFSQQPPKERKVSLEDIAIELWSLFDTNNEIKWSEIHESLRHFYMIRAQAILSLINATEGR